MRFSILLAAMTLPMIAAPAHAAEDTQFWVSEALTFKADDNDSITLDFSQRARSDADSGGEQSLNRITWDHRIADGVQIGGGFAYLKSEVDQELRFHQQLTASHGILQSRTRLEQRFFDNADEPSWRLRERIQATVPLDADKKWALVGGTELFFQLNRAKASDKTGLAASAGRSANRSMSSCSTCANRHSATTNPTPSTMCPGFRSTGGSDQATICVRRASG